VANIKSAKKRIRTSEKARLRNKAVRTGVRTAVKKFAEAPVAERPAALAATVSTIDKAVSKGVLHANTAARRKSRLARISQAAK
jgi:small subunit ribosomal protein S20